MPFTNTDKDLDVRPWELYNLNDDPSQAHNLAEKNPEKLKELIKVFDEEATRNHAYPILPARSSPLDATQRNKTSFVFRSGDERVPLRYAPGFFGHGYTIDADVIIPPDGAEGVILADGGELGGLSLFVKNNRVYYEVNASNEHSDQLVATQILRPGLQHIELAVTPDPASDNRLAGRWPRRLPGPWSGLRLGPPFHQWHSSGPKPILQCLRFWRDPRRGQ